MAKEKKRIEIEEQIAEIGSYLENDIDDVISFFIEAKKEYMQKGYIDLWIKSDLPYMGSDYINWYIYGSRLENDKEYRKRLKREAIKATIKKQLKKQKIEHEKQELKRLITKYPEESIARTNG